MSEEKPPHSREITTHISNERGLHSTISVCSMQLGLTGNVVVGIEVDLPNVYMAGTLRREHVIVLRDKLIAAIERPIPHSTLHT